MSEIQNVNIIDSSPINKWEKNKHIWTYELSFPNWTTSKVDIKASEAWNNRVEVSFWNETFVCDNTDLSIKTLLETCQDLDALTTKVFWVEWWVKAVKEALWIEAFWEYYKQNSQDEGMQSLYYKWKELWTFEEIIFSNISESLVVAKSSTNNNDSLAINIGTNREMSQSLYNHIYYNWEYLFSSESEVKVIWESIFVFDNIIIIAEWNGFYNFPFDVSENDFKQISDYIRLNIQDIKKYLIKINPNTSVKDIISQTSREASKDISSIQKLIKRFSSKCSVIDILKAYTRFEQTEYPDVDKSKLNPQGTADIIEKELFFDEVFQEYKEKWLISEKDIKDIKAIPNFRQNFVNEPNLTKAKDYVEMNIRNKAVYQILSLNWISRADLDVIKSPDYIMTFDVKYIIINPNSLEEFDRAIKGFILNYYIVYSSISSELSDEDFQIFKDTVLNANPDYNINTHLYKSYSQDNIINNILDSAFGSNNNSWNFIMDLLSNDEASVDSWVELQFDYGILSYNQAELLESFEYYEDSNWKVFWYSYKDHNDQYHLVIPKKWEDILSWVVFTPALEKIKDVTINWNNVTIEYRWPNSSNNSNVSTMPSSYRGFRNVATKTYKKIISI